jgi:hypothetical protein
MAAGAQSNSRLESFRLPPCRLQLPAGWEAKLKLAGRHHAYRRGRRIRRGRLVLRDLLAGILIAGITALLKGNSLIVRSATARE